MRICVQLREYGEDGVNFPNEVLGKDSAQVSCIYEGFGQGSGCADAAGVYGESDLMIQVRYPYVCLNVLKRIRSRA